MYKLLFILLLITSCSSNSSNPANTSNNLSSTNDSLKMWSFKIVCNAKNDSLLLGTNISFSFLIDSSLNTNYIDSQKIDFNGDGIWESSLPGFIDNFDYYIYNTPGHYNIITALKDSVIWKYDTLQLTVYQKKLYSNNAPLLTLNPPYIINMLEGDLWASKEPGFTATDAEDGDITDSVKITVTAKDSSIKDINKFYLFAGTYNITYRVEDSEKASDSKSRTVVIKKIQTDIPEILLYNNNTIEVSNSFTDTVKIIDPVYETETAKLLKVSLFDINNKEINNILFSLEFNGFDVIITSQTIATLPQGLYTVHYDVTNKDNLKAVTKQKDIVIK